MNLNGGFIFIYIHDVSVDIDLNFWPHVNKMELFCLDH